MMTTTAARVVRSDVVMPRKRSIPKRKESRILWDYGIRDTFEEALAVAVKRGAGTIPLRLPDGKWAIAARACLIEWHAALSDLPMPPEALAAYAAVGTSTRDPTDMSYQRPLQVRHPEK